ncbi:MAG: transposase [Roseivirga sp.]
MTGLLLLQRIFNLSDERLVELWQENPYFQCFCGKNAFQWTQPCAASDLKESLNKAQRVIANSTIQEKNITFPNDAKRYRKVIDTCNDLAKRLGIGLRL